MKLEIKQSGKLIEVLKEFFPSSSMTTLRSWIKQGRILRQHEELRIPSQEITAPTLLTFQSPKKSIRFGIQVLYEDQDLIVLNKPAGLLSVATNYEKNQTVHSALKEHATCPVVYPVHRLDRETSGVMVFTYNQKTRDGLKKQFFLHSIQREYHALVEGHMESSKGTWSSFLKEDATYFVSSHPEGKQAITHYEVVRRTSAMTALKLRLETGRKNQIRAHASEAGFPIVGDKKYGSKLSSLGRLGLHASLLILIHPTRNKEMRFESPLPPSFIPVFKKEKKK